ncbi:Prolyl tripeptidyl peptidase precursor [Salinivirga cyanobacteriivorans]|uniref:Prolyl tripeptidyl peptidase n=1 Tax=Salinivirga cyanobacteriivorans TaxID=1307839 RepID=A0A0S2HWV0_9BACT|nr:prolyl oligopeptidase family serine peptidase [Salinivirga cyanobacteriivorans]ALO14495.1 Prolyl tripeptidyl peptidase precursor [Salinivirga cyanobacteriivorans]
MKRLIPIAILLMTNLTLFSQVDIDYQVPPIEILDLADVDMAPSMRIDDEGKHMVLISRNQYKSIAELSEKEMRLAGLRINPKTNISSRERFYNDLSVMEVGDQEATKVKGLPEEPRLSNFSWSPDEKYMAFTNTTNQGVELWVLDVDNAKAKKLTPDNLNANMGRPFTWFKNSESLLIKQLPKDRKPLIDKDEAVPTGPRISINEGQKAQNRTYQDLLEDKIDEANFEQLVRAEISKVDLKGNISPWMEAKMYRYMSFSPDGEYVLVTTIHKPFSYLVPYYRFPTDYNIYTKNGEHVKTIEEVPLTEEMPKGFMAVREGKRRIDWRNDRPATLVYAEALDGGDPEKEVDHRDQVYTWKAPFENEPQKLVKTFNRYSGVLWGSDNLALVYDYWWNTRKMKAYFINPEDRSKEPVIIMDRNYQDRYNDPGSPVTTKNKFGERIMQIDGDYIYLEGDGYSPEGILPFIDKFHIETHETERLWRAKANDQLERIMFALDMKKGKILTRIESKNKYPNYYIRDIRKENEKEAITFFKNPFESLSNVQKELIKYNREDGVALSATLYLPEDYDKNSGEKLPMLMWAYPYEFKDKASAGQITTSPNEFTYPWYGSPIFWVQRGFAILDDASFPIIGEGDEEPNDTFIKQLVANAKAAIDAVDSMGYVDTDKVAVGGHSYGAFMTANLLSHSDLFAAGIARSGAYNRTLTPFGFQAEERNYWEAPEIYYNMSPFMHADEMNSNLLLIHGEADNNSGTYPMQSERYFNALKGLGANVRLVMLPKESHGYRARESVLHVLWEQDQWLMKYVKNIDKD